MLVHIGLILALYVIFQALPARRPRAKSVAGKVAVLVAVGACIDIGYAAIYGKALFSELVQKPETASRAGETSAEALSPRAPEVSITRADGGSITTQLGYGIAVAKDSSLRREWIVVHDTRVPVQLSGTPGVSTVYESERYGGEYRYQAKFVLEVEEVARSIEVRFLTFDVWGQHVRTLTFSQVSDLPVGSTELTGKWRLFDENDVEEHYASIGYVARVRLADGRIIEMDTTPVVEEARKFSEKFEAEDLEPEKSEPRGGDEARRS